MTAHRPGLQALAHSRHSTLRGAVPAAGQGYDAAHLLRADRKAARRKHRPAAEPAADRRS